MPCLQSRKTDAQTKQSLTADYHTAIQSNSNPIGAVSTFKKFGVEAYIQGIADFYIKKPTSLLFQGRM